MYHRFSIEEGRDLGSSMQNAIVVSALTIPITVSAMWLNWIIVRFTLVLPTQYLLQVNTVLFSWLRFKCCARAVQGGGSEGPIPYRIYVDSGVVMLCLFALAPASPLIAIAAFFYFVFCIPILRWVIIFLHNPKVSFILYGHCDTNVIRSDFCIQYFRCNQSMKLTHFFSYLLAYPIPPHVVRHWRGPISFYYRHMC